MCLRVLLITSLFSFLFTSCYGGTGNSKQNYDEEKARIHKSGSSLCIAFYNVENLFDTLDAPGIDDAEFLPQGKKSLDVEKIP
jgi:hypothetical protein